MELLLIRSARTVVAAVTWLAALVCPASSVFADTPIQLRNVTGNWKGTLSSTAWQTAADIQLVLYQSDQELRGRLYCEGGQEPVILPEPLSRVPWTAAGSPPESAIQMVISAA